MSASALSSQVRQHAAESRGRDSAASDGSADGRFEHAWLEVKSRAAAELEAAKALFPGIEEQARNANLKRARRPLEIPFEARSVRVLGQWPGGHGIEFTATISAPLGSGKAVFEANAREFARLQFNDGYEWEVTIL